MYQCSHPDCSHVAEFITNIHCVDTHGKSKAAIHAEFGKPEKLVVNGIKLSQNTKREKETNPFARRGSGRSDVQRRMDRYYS